MPSRSQKLDLRELDEGDRVTMDIQAHNYERSGPVLTGEITEFPRESEIELLYDDDGFRPLANLAVTGDNGTKWTWNIDNGYVIGPVDMEGRPARSDIGRFAGLYPPESRTEFERERDAGTN